MYQARPNRAHRNDFKGHQRDAPFHALPALSCGDTIHAEYGRSERNRTSTTCLPKTAPNQVAQYSVCERPAISMMQKVSQVPKRRNSTYTFNRMTIALPHRRARYPCALSDAHQPKTTSDEYLGAPTFCKRRPKTSASRLQAQA